MDTHLAELSRTIDAAELGRRMRIARVAAGMTQAQVAGDDVSAAYLSRIEDGQRRPEAGLLERMANRMGVTLEDLLLDVPRDKVHELRLAVDHARLSLISGDPDGALAAVGAVLDDPATERIDFVQRAARQVRAGALEASGDLDGAILLLEDLTSAPTPDAGWLEALVALCRCYRDSGDHTRAISIAERSATMIDELGLSGLSEAVELTVTVAGAYELQGDTGQAMRMCARTLEAAEQHDSAVGKATAYWKASRAEAQRGGTQAALELSDKALALFALSDDNRNLATLRAQVANLQLLSDPADPAAALATLAGAEQELAWSGASATEVALVHLTRGKAHFALGDHDAARSCVEKATATAPEDASVLRASVSVLRGRIAFADGDREAARELFRDGVTALTAAGSDRRAAQLWFELAELLTEVGDTEGAVQAFRSAGASTGLRVPARTSAAVPQR
ncbi:helix-turn-helix domain-containing protein [Pimelobacter simplex]|uniref:helix-turn-helix domain-containing protein n=1 Tax=Nocardioides simplex TaxID=2045 RepID=UPI0021505682|nr:helix-turn-helix domain-containing protein [Pimelobacter simplex]UUW90412.1 helix-turn-helix domain-containing protein [Pimelobacter simplex]UUW94242.1 helix-turn-helix domain-containing protein [Pimelobacter simplex]